MKKEGSVFLIKILSDVLIWLNEINFCMHTASTPRSIYIIIHRRPTHRFYRLSVNFVEFEDGLLACVLSLYPQCWFQIFIKSCKYTNYYWKKNPKIIALQALWKHLKCSLDFNFWVISTNLLAEIEWFIIYTKVNW